VTAIRSPKLIDHDTFVRLYRSRDFIAEEFDRPIALEDAAREACLSPYHYHRLFVRAFGQTPHDFLTERRLDEAKRRLLQGDQPITEICFDLGYSSPGSFSTLFSRNVGMSPSEFRRERARIYSLFACWPHRFLPACFLIRNRR